MVAPETTSAPTQTRRTVLRTAAWSAPVIAASTAAPAFAAASPCADGYLDYVLDYSSWNRVSTTQASGVATPVEGAGAPITVTVSVTTIPRPAGSTGPVPVIEARNLQIFQSVINPDTPIATPRPSGNSVALIQQAAVSGSGQAVRFSFGRTVENLRFAIGDLDASGVGTSSFYRDGVTLTPNRTSASNGPVPGGSVSTQGTGLSGSPWRVSDNYAGSHNDTGAWEVRPVYSSTSEFTVRYTNYASSQLTSTNANLQVIFVSPLYFRVPC